MEPTLSTDRLDLTPFCEEDVEELHALFTDSAVRRYLLDDQVVSRDWVVDEVDSSRLHFDEEGWGLWSARAKGERPILGFVGYRHFFEPPELQLLYGFLPSAWGRGFAVEAASEAVRYGFEELGFDEVRAATDAPNAASIRVLERLGMSCWRREPGDEWETLFFRVVRA